MNITWAKSILSLLHEQGVREIVICPGARNSPFVTVLAKTNGFILHSFFEERSAAFFALGIARRTGQPVAVCTTSGTAACELLPCVAEAFHTGVPIVFLTADRPKRLRGSGAPQSIDQAGIFSRFTGVEFDLENGETFSMGNWNRRTPVHLNICFDEPLIDEVIEDFELPMRPARESFAGKSGFSSTAGAEWASLRLTKFIRTAEAKESAILVLVGSLETSEEREAIADFLKRIGAPVYLESTSGMRERADLKNISLRSGDRVLSWALRRGLYSSVIRIGGIPTARIWRDLDEMTSTTEVFSLSALPMAGLSRGEFICSEIAPALAMTSVTQQPAHLVNAFLMKDRTQFSALESIIQSNPHSEPSQFRALSEIIPDESLVYIGNSLPIREWDMTATLERVKCVEANRGVNGIDGQISTFFGLAREKNENWAIVGDLTALYDLVSFWSLRGRENLKARIVVINNGGGKIFSRLFKTELFLNRHEISFEHLAKLWSVGYRKWTEVPKTLPDCSGIEIIELQPNENSTQEFWNRYDDLWP